MTQSPTNSHSEKIELEHAAAKLFMRAYEKLTGQEIRHIWHNEPSKPDVSCRLKGERLDMEIAHLYGTEHEAMALLGRELSEQTRAALLELEAESDSHQRLLDALNRILASKAGKQYESDRVWLVIRNVNPAWTAEEIARLQHCCINVPVEHPFEQIWMVGDYAGESGIVQLYP